MDRDRERDILKLSVSVRQIQTGRYRKRWEERSLNFLKFYNQFHRFRSLLVSKLFLDNFDHFRREHSFFEAAGAAAEIDSSLKSNHH